jgi:hypothetical protein
MLPLSFIAVGALAYRVAAQTASFENTSWGSVVVGQVWPIHWTAGDGTPVSLFLGNDTWQWNIFGMSTKDFHRSRLLTVTQQTSLQFLDHMTGLSMLLQVQFPDSTISAWSKAIN